MCELMNFSSEERFTETALNFSTRERFTKTADER